MTPEIPTIAEGGVPGFGRASGFIGLFAPAGTPAAVVKKISREVAAILATPNAQATARALTSAAAYEDDETLKKMTDDVFADVMKSSDTKEGLTAFIEKRTPKWTGA